jgi:hypothetical protein
MNSEMKSGKRRCFRAKFLLFIPVVAGVLLIKGGLIMLLWNFLVPDLFHGPLITYPQALAVMVLAKLLVGFGFGGRGHHGGFGKFRRMRERFENSEMEKNIHAGMTDEERQKLREELRKRWDR